MSFEGGEQPDTGVAPGGADPVLAWLKKSWRAPRSWALPCWVAAGIWYITPRNIIVCQISLELLLMMDENQKKLAHFTIHHQATNNILVHCNCKHCCKRKMQRTHSSDCFSVLAPADPECLASVLPNPFVPSIQLAWPWEQTWTTPSPNVPGVPGGDRLVLSNLHV